ncbi:hypothetical protein FACS189441_4680 [Betaproteobacteria bacterium]|nr:hypothetical protein FACS189441_4680 [Betaproteobacteria bacterium]
MNFVDPYATQRTQAKQIVEFSNDLVTAARASIKDEALQAKLDLQLLPQTYIELKALYGKGLSGDALNAKIREKASQSIDDALALINQLGCFVAGTLVHTKEGLRPIEEIKVGDYVLSKPESGNGELCYQPVTQTYEYENRELYCLIWAARKELPEGEKMVEDFGYIAVTAGHPIWVSQLGFWISSTSTRESEDIRRWMSVEELYIWMRDSQNDELIDKSLDRIYAELADGRAAIITAIHPILQSDDPDIGVAFHDWECWESVDEFGGRTLCFGKDGVRGYLVDHSIDPLTHLWQIDTSAYDYSGYDTESDMSVVRRSGGYLPMRRKVYNLEVANTHTYFVTRLGLWVHNTSKRSADIRRVEKRSAFHHPTDQHKQPPPQRLTDVRAQTHDGEDAIAPEKRPRSAR